MDAALIALIGLGGLYTISNQKDKIVKEGFVSGTQELKQDIENTVMDYIESNEPKDKYYTGNKILGDLKNINNNSVSFTSLNGEKVGINDLAHNNMVPYFGSKIRGRGANVEQGESLLDNKVGSGSQVFKKKECAPLFEPSENMHWANGQPNFSNFLQSRQNPSMSMNNVKPWEEQREAPGLSKDGTSSLGFNSGIMSRESWLPKTVDDLRVDTNPKNTFELRGHEGPALSSILKPGVQGEVMKNRAETSYVNSPERYIVTGVVGGSRPRDEQPVELLKCQSRPETTVSYHGNAGIVDQPAAMVQKNYVEGTSAHIYGQLLGGASSSDNQPITDGDYGINGYSADLNNRVSTKQAVEFGSAGGTSNVIGSVVSPIMDMLRPSRKEDTINGIRQSGNVQAGYTETMTVNPADRVKTTIRDTLKQPFHLNVNAAQTSDGYVNANQIDKTTQRESTDRFQFNNWNGSIHSIRLDDAERNQRNNTNKLTPATHVLGNMNIFDGTYNQARPNISREQNNINAFAPTNMPKNCHSVDTYPKLSGGQHYDNIQNNDRIHPEILDAFKKNPYTQSLNSSF